MTSERTLEDILSGGISGGIVDENPSIDIPKEFDPSTLDEVADMPTDQPLPDLHEMVMDQIDADTAIERALLWCQLGLESLSVVSELTTENDRSNESQALQNIKAALIGIAKKIAAAIADFAIKVMVFFKKIGIEGKLRALNECKSDILDTFKKDEKMKERLNSKTLPYSLSTMEHYSDEIVKILYHADAICKELANPTGTSGLHDDIAELLRSSNATIAKSDKEESYGDKFPLILDYCANIANYNKMMKGTSMIRNTTESVKKTIIQLNFAKFLNDNVAHREGTSENLAEASKLFHALLSTMQHISTNHMKMTSAYLTMVRTVCSASSAILRDRMKEYKSDAKETEDLRKNVTEFQAGFDDKDGSISGEYEIA